MERLNEIVENLETAWNNGELTEYAYQVASLYSSNNFTLISSVMIEFKKRING
jgi:hypothetical protein